LKRWRPSPGKPAEWIPWVRLAAVPFALADAALEEWPPGHSPWAWALAAALVLGAVALALVRDAPPALALAFDLLLVSGVVSLYGFEPNSAVRLLFVLTALEGGLLLGRMGAVGAALASTPALAVFEWRSADRLDVSLDLGHVVGPVGIQLLFGLAVAALAGRRG
jgi:hypothetical protein